MKIVSLETGNLKLDGGAMFGVVPKVLWEKVYPADEKNLCNLAMRSLLIVEGDRRILIDTGIGDKQDATFLGYYYLNGDDTLENSLMQNGLTPADITDVILTHLHFDHVGGAVKRTAEGLLLPAFPNASYYVSRQQWDWATMPNNREKASFLPENFLPLQEHDCITFIEERDNSLPNIELRLFNGHTTGQIVPFIDYNGQTIVYAADLIPLASQVPIAWLCAYDIRPLVSMDEKEQFLKESISNNYALFFEHDIYQECCTLKQTAKGVRVEKGFALSQLTGYETLI